MKRVIQFATALLLLSVVTSSFASSITNREEYKGDAKLTKAQQEKFQQLLNSGVQHFQDTQYDAAETDFKAILEFAPKKNLAYYNLGLTKYRQGDYQGAIDYFDQVIKKHSYYVGAAFYYKSICQLN